MNLRNLLVSFVCRVVLCCWSLIIDRHRLCFLMLSTGLRNMLRMKPDLLDCRIFIRRTLKLKYEHLRFQKSWDYTQILLKRGGARRRGDKGMEREGERYKRTPHFFIRVFSWGIAQKPLGELLISTDFFSLGLPIYCHLVWKICPKSPRFESNIIPKFFSSGRSPPFPQAP